ncbi:MAG: hypothetical protein WAV08_14140, partial [Desulfobacterales bacterium]
MSLAGRMGFLASFPGYKGPRRRPGWADVIKIDGSAKSVLPRLAAVFFAKGTLSGTPAIGLDSPLPLFFVHFLLRKRKRTKRN